MRLYHKLHKNPCKSKRATQIRNVAKRVTKIMGSRKRNPSASGFGKRGGGGHAREVFEDIFTFQRMAADFHGLEVQIVGKKKFSDGSVGYTIAHPWFPGRGRGKARKFEIDVRVCSGRRAREIGAISMMPLATIGRREPPSFDEEAGEGIDIADVEEFCCLAEEPEKPGPGKAYGKGILLCAGRRREGKVAIGVGKRAEEDVVDLYQELEKLTRQELDLLDVELSPGRKRPGPVSRARKAYLESSPLSEEGPELEKKYRALEARLGDVRGRKRELEKQVKRSQTSRPGAFKQGARKLGGRGMGLQGRPFLSDEGFLAGGGDATARGLTYRYGEEVAGKLGREEREFKEEFIRKTSRIRRMGKGKKLPFNERFLIEETPLIAVIWDGRAVDPLTGKTVGEREHFTWSVSDGSGREIKRGVVKKSKSGGGVGTVSSQIKRVVKGVMSGAGALRGTAGAAGLTELSVSGHSASEYGGFEAGTIQEALVSKRSMPSLVLGEHLIVQFVPKEKFKVTKADLGKRSGSDLRDVMRWGFPSLEGLVEFYRDRGGYNVTVKFPSGEKHTATRMFKNMGEAVEYSMYMMQEYTGINKWLVEEGTSWSERRARRPRRARANPRGKLRATSNPDLFETMKDILAPPFVTRPKRKTESISASAVPQVGHHFRDIAHQLDGKEAFDFGFTFGVLRGIDTCGMKDLAERRRIRRYIEQQVIDAVYSLAVEAPARRESNPGRRPKKKTIRWKHWDPKKNPDPIEALKDIVAPPFITRAKRKRASISVSELPDLKEHFVELAWSLSGQAGYDFGFVFGVLRGIDTCGLMKVGERRRIRRRIEQELMDAAYGLSVEVPGE